MTTLFKPIVSALFAMSAAWGADLATYRNFQLGADLAVVAKQARQDPSQAKVIQSRPGLIQELGWRPQPGDSSSQAKDILFSFYQGRLFRITVNYDRYELDGLTTDDLVEAISVTYGNATRPVVPNSVGYGDHEEVLAQWQDSTARIDLIRFSYGRDFKLIAVLKTLEAQVEAAMVEAVRLDAQDAPQREAARIAREQATERARLDKARLANKARFRP
jgi:hypothetical protein